MHGTKDDTSSICREDGHHVEIQWEPNEFKGHRSNASLKEECEHDYDQNEKKHP